MMKMRKIIISSFSVVFLASTLVTSTYAYVVIGRNADVREFNFNIENTTGLLLSLDGKNFSSGLTSKMLTSVIAPDGNYDELKFTGVTPKSENGLVLTDTNNLLFVKDNVNNNEHSYIDATKNIDYISFDLYFKIINSNNNDSFNLYITNNSYIKGTLENVLLSNKLSTLENDYKSGDEISVNSQNAMRLAISLIENDSINNTNYYEITDEFDLGSSAVENGTDKHDKNKNAMYTYYNNCFPLYPFTSAAEDNESFNTKNQFMNDDNDYISQFSYDDSINDYNIVHSKIYLWLEGWDSDYFMGLPTICNNLDIKLQFEIK